MATRCTCVTDTRINDLYPGQAVTEVLVADPFCAATHTHQLPQETR